MLSAQSGFVSASSLPLSFSCSVQPWSLWSRESYCLHPVSLREQPVLFCSLLTGGETDPASPPPQTPCPVSFLQPRLHSELTLDNPSGSAPEELACLPLGEDGSGRKGKRTAHDWKKSSSMSGLFPGEMRLRSPRPDCTACPGPSVLRAGAAAGSVARGFLEQGGDITG